MEKNILILPLLDSLLLTFTYCHKDEERKGKGKAYAEYLSGNVSTGKSDDILFEAGTVLSKNIGFTIPNGTTTNLRIVLATENGTMATVNSVSLFMKNKK